MTTQSPSMASQATAELPSPPRDVVLAFGHTTPTLKAYGLACYEAGRASRAQSEWISVEDERIKQIANSFAGQNGWDGVDGAPVWLIELVQDVAAAMVASEPVRAMKNEMAKALEILDDPLTSTDDAPDYLDNEFRIAFLATGETK